MLPAVAFHSGPLTTAVTGVPVNGFGTDVVAVVGVTVETTEEKEEGVLVSGFAITNEEDDADTEADEGVDTGSVEPVRFSPVKGLRGVADTEGVPAEFTGGCKAGTGRDWLTAPPLFDASF